MHTIVILTGAGISAESGLATFRDNNGLWCNHRVEDVATPEAFQCSPALVHEFYNQRRRKLKEASPNAAHLALVQLAQEWNGRLLLITQNVDDLHDRAAARQRLGNGYQLLHMHGELRKARCTATEQVFDWENDITVATPCPCCSKTGRLRPHIVWFGEMPLYMDLIYEVLQDCDLFLSIGTSGSVYPSAGFVQEVRSAGRGHTVELNMEPSTGHSLFREKIYGPATQTVPAYVRRILAEQRNNGDSD
jgi:NAD-dependent deacetylase